MSNWSLYVCFAAYFSSSPKENAFRSLEEHLWTIHRKTEFPDFSLTLTISKIFTDFLKNFPTTLKNFHFFSWLFRDSGNRDDKDGQVSTVCKPVHVYEYSKAFISRDSLIFSWSWSQLSLFRSFMKPSVFCWLHFPTEPQLISAFFIFLVSHLYFSE